MSPPAEINLKEFWENQGQKYGANRNAVNFDPIGERLPLTLLDDVIADGLTVCDLGCGNGRTLVQLADKRPNGCFIGLDFSESLIEAAKTITRKKVTGNIEFHVFDVNKDQIPEYLAGFCDVVISKRLLINLQGLAKRQAVEKVYDLLKPGGIYLMMECFLEPLRRINDMRTKIGLNEIRVRPFNEYLEEDFIENISDLFSIEREVDYEGLYYFISRIFNAYLSDGEPAYDAPINQLAEKLLSLGFNPIKGYSPELGYVLKTIP